MTDFIATEQAAYPDIAQRYQRLKDLHVRKYVLVSLRSLPLCILRLLALPSAH